MESKTNAPSFTVSLRGYDRMEVDEYLDSLAEALGQVEEAEERSRGLQAHIERLNARIADLEERIRSDVPKTGAILAERISIMLRSAEETAADTINRAEANAAEMIEKARDEVASAEDQARGAIARGEEQARRIESAARAEAAEIIAEAEGRASTRTRQIEQWAEQVISHTRAEEARMLAEQHDKREQGEAELQALTEQRDAVAANIAELRESLGQALGLVGAARAAAPPAAERRPVDEAEAGEDEAVAAERGETTETGQTGESALEAVAEAPSPTDGESEDGADDRGDEEEMPWPAAFRPVEDEADADADGAADRAADRAADDDEEPVGAEADHTGEIELRDLPTETAAGATDGDAVEDSEGGAGAPDEADEFETKFEAWVSGSLGPRHFRRL